MPDAAYAVPTQNITENGFRGFLPSTWSEDSLEVFPDEILGKYDVEIEWNGTRTLTIEKDNLRWNGARLTPTAVWCQRSHGISDFATRFTAFCPEQRTVWVKRGTQRGVVESLDISFELNDAGNATGLVGTFRRQGEGTLGVRGAKAFDADQLPTLVRTKSNDPESQCPVCYSEWDDPGVTQVVVTTCEHCFCLECVVGVCSLTPPAESGSCPICRREMVLHDLRTVRRERGGTPENPAGKPPPGCLPCA